MTPPRPGQNRVPINAPAAPPPAAPITPATVDAAEVLTLYQ
jgi:hypothetical protein